MAKIFYTLDETGAALGKTDEQIKELAREGRLREYRDGQRPMFRADQVEAIKMEPGGIRPPPTSSHGAGQANSINLLGASAPIGSGDGAIVGGTKDTALAADLGLTGSLRALPPPGQIASGVSVSGMYTAPRTDITIFTPDEAARREPPAQSDGSSATFDQIRWGAVGSRGELLNLSSENEYIPAPPDQTAAGGDVIDNRLLQALEEANAALRKSEATVSQLNRDGGANANRPEPRHEVNAVDTSSALTVDPAPSEHTLPGPESASAATISLDVEPAQSRPAADKRDQLNLGSQRDQSNQACTVEFVNPAMQRVGETETQGELFSCGEKLERMLAWEQLQLAAVVDSAARVGDPNQAMEFVAVRLLQGKIGQKNVLLGTPLYIALTEDPQAATNNP